MDTLEQFRKFLSEYVTYIRTELRPEHRRVRATFEQWRKPDFWSNYASIGGVYPSPIKAIFTRIKRPERVVDKILQKPDNYPDGLSSASFHKMHDCIGVRIIVYFLSQLPIIDRELRTTKLMELSSELPPKAYLPPDLLRRFGLAHIPAREKESGYSSIHYVLRLAHPQKSKKTSHNPWFEVQVRTMSQELWCEMEHILAYTSDRRTDFMARRRFQILSRQISAIDEEFNLLYEELLQNQETTKPDPEEVLRNENLPYVLSLIGIRCALQDFDVIISLLHSRGIRTIRDFVNIATPRRMETIKNTYISITGRPPDNFELIACLGSIVGMNPTEDESQHVASHIEYSKTWNKYRKQIMTQDPDSPRTYR